MKSCFHSKNSVNESTLEAGGITILEMIFRGIKVKPKASISFKGDLSFTFHLSRTECRKVRNSLNPCSFHCWLHGHEYRVRTL